MVNFIVKKAPGISIYLVSGAFFRIVIYSTKIFTTEF